MGHATTAHSGQSQNPHAVSGQLQASLLQPFNIGSHYTHPVSFILNDYKKISVTFSLFANPKNISPISSFAEFSK